MVGDGSEEDGNVMSEHEEDEDMTDNGDSDNDWYRQIESDLLCVLST
jgi:hypothetical protein